MGLTARVLKLERSARPTDDSRIGVVNERDLDGGGLGAVVTYPGGERMSVTAFEARFPRAGLVVRKSFGRPTSDGERARW